MHGPRGIPKNTTYSVAGRKSGGKASHAGASSPRRHHAPLVNLPYMTPKKAEKSWPRCWMYKVNPTIICH